MKENIKEYICLIDDEYQVIKALTRELSDYAEENSIGLKVYPSPLECLQELPQIADKTSVIISDLRMPGMKGSDFFLSLNKEYPDIELIMLTAYNDIDDIQKAITARIRSLILKPWDPDKLLLEIADARSFHQMKTDDDSFRKMIDYQLETAGDFQKKLLDTTIPEIQNAKVELSYIPYEKMKIGGDYYDIIKLDEARFLVNIGDVVGHGVKPAFVTAMLKVLTSSISKKNRSELYTPGRLLKLLNKQLCSLLKNSGEMLVTFSSLLIDTEKRTLTLANAGHMPLYIINKENCTSHVVDGPALGYLPDMAYAELEIPLHEDDIIVVYTDGLLESEILHTKIREEVVQRFLVEAGRDQDFNESVIKKSKMVRDIEHFHDDVSLISIHI